jgi:hypothetical protein
LDVFGVVVRLAVFPTPEQNPYPLESESSQRSVMLFTTVSHLIVVRTCPLAKPDGLIRELVERLLDKFGARQSVMNRFRLAALFRDWSDTGMRLHLRCGLPA